VSVCVCVCVCVCLSVRIHICLNTRPIFARFSSGGVAIRYVLPVYG